MVLSPFSLAQGLGDSRMASLEDQGASASELNKNTKITQHMLMF